MLVSEKNCVSVLPRLSCSISWTRTL